MQKLVRYDLKLLFLLLTLVAVPCIFLSSFAVQAIRGQKIIIEQKIEQSYTALAVNAKKRILDNIYSSMRNIDLILLKQSLWQNSPAVSILNTILKDPVFKNFYLLDSDFKIIYPQERPKVAFTKEIFFGMENLPIFENAYIQEFQKNDFMLAIAEYQRIVSELQEKKLESLGHALLGIARCYLKAKKPDRALQVYQNLHTLFKDQNDQQSLTFVIDAQLQVAEIYLSQYETILYYRVLLELFETLVHYEHCLSKSQYIYYHQIIQEKLNELDEYEKNIPEYEPLLRAKENILERQKRMAMQEKEIRELRENLISTWKIQLPENFGYFSFSSLTEQPKLFFYQKLEQDSCNGYVIYNIDLEHCLKKIILPILKEQDLEADVFLTVVQQNGTPLFGKLEEPIFFVVSQTLSPIFPFWQIAIYIKNIKSLEDLSRYQSQLYFLGIMTIVLILLVGVYVVIITFLREVQNARFRSDFVSNITHELKTPLTSIKMFVETLLMERAKTPEDQKECLQIISAESDRLSRLIDRILNLAKIQQNKKIFQFKATYIPNLIDDCISDFRKQVAESLCSIQLEIDPHLPEISMDSEAFQEVIVNLLSNAYKYNNKIGRQIIIRAKLDKPNLFLLSIRDNGIGIPRHEFHRIFQKFYRVENDWTKKTAGSGLGLALVDSIVQAHKGEIEVQSKTNVGTEIRIYLPTATK